MATRGLAATLLLQWPFFLILFLSYETSPIFSDSAAADGTCTFFCASLVFVFFCFLLLPPSSSSCINSLLSARYCPSAPPLAPPSSPTVTDGPSPVPIPPSASPMVNTVGSPSLP